MEIISRRVNELDEIFQSIETYKDYLYMLLIIISRIRTSIIQIGHVSYLEAPKIPLKSQFPAAVYAPILSKKNQSPTQTSFGTLT